MANDYIQITPEEPEGTLLGLWWRKPPYEIRRATYAPYRGPGVRPVPEEAQVLACAPSDKPGEWTEPTVEPGLLNALLDVGQGRLKPVAFADRFGLLGYNELVPDENRCKGGEPLDWFRAQALTALTVVELIDHLEEAKESAGGRRHLANYLKEELTNGPYTLGGKVAEVMIQGSSPIITANSILRCLLNANLGDAGRRLQMRNGELRTIFTFHALVQVIYWQLADQIGKSSIRRCAECGRVFTSSNVRSRFCLPVGGKKISACKSRWNVREFRKKKKRSRRKK
jgi:hypothetical protein